MDNLEKQPSMKKTLINSIDRLNMTSEKLKDLSNFSSILIDKIKRVDHNSAPIEPGDLKNNGDTPDIVDLFNIINDKMNIYIDIIGSNVEKVIDIID